ncbi:MAG TPA: DUF1570 domain-containing protein [Pirellulales bacterium]|nr:DUF1570 domain-containing protein [Pirellulales bacterium]
MNSLVARFSCIAAILLGAAELRAETVGEARASLVEGHVGRLGELAQWCEEQGLDREAEITRGWLPPVEPLVLFVPLVEDATDRAAASDRDARLSQAWRERFDTLRQTQAAALFALVARAVEEHRYSIGFELLHETLREDPQHEAARLLLGYRERDAHWLTRYEWAKAQVNQVWDARFGWLPKSQLARYAGGERFFKGRWVGAEEDARQRGALGGWEVTTEHYRVRTNHSLEEGVRLASRLERLYDVWRQVFVRYYLTDAELGKLLAGGGLPVRAMLRYNVTYFSNRTQYVEALKSQEPNIAISTGYYRGKSKTAYFFAGEEQDDSNLYHEATHQLFSETRNVGPHVGRDANFWVIEGIACSMESLVEGDRYCTIGGADALRLDNARTRLLRDDFYVPLAELTAIGMNALQRDAQRISPIYSESSGLTYFLMFAQGGRYRDALVDYLVAIYTGRDGPQTLAELTQTPYAELDRQYREFMTSNQFD